MGIFVRSSFVGFLLKADYMVSWKRKKEKEFDYNSQSNTYLFNRRGAGSMSDSVIDTI